MSVKIQEFFKELLVQTGNYTQYFEKFDKVCIFTEKDRPYDQSESMATRYINRFAIDEDDQFEIHVYHKDTAYIRDDVICETMEALINKAKKGSFEINLLYVA